MYSMYYLSVVSKHQIHCIQTYFVPNVLQEYFEINTSFHRLNALFIYLFIYLLNFFFLFFESLDPILQQVLKHGNYSPWRSLNQLMSDQLKGQINQFESGKQLDTE